MNIKQEFKDNIYEGAIDYYKNKMNHSKALDYIVQHFFAIGEDPRNINWVMREGIWMPKNTDYLVFPDFILGFANKQAVPVEYKSMKSHKDHALIQLESGKRFIKDVLGYDVPYSKFVWPVGNKYKFEVIK